MPRPVVPILPMPWLLPSRACSRARSSSPWSGRIRGAFSAMRLEKHGLASSVRGIDFMVRYMHQQVGMDLSTAVRMASLTPAGIIGLQDEIGSLESGKKADIILVDRVTGKPITEKEHRLAPGPAASERVRQRYASKRSRA